ncbi:MAG: S8 family peptidase [Lachnospiraceae bacterium]|nr:S8 family peptidase [Lachnospiraceae bacterium]
MNKILQLKGHFDSNKGPKPGPAKLPPNTEVNVEHIDKLVSRLESIFATWKEDTRLKGALVSVHYRRVIAKSNRLKIILGNGSKSPNESIRGAKFVGEGNERHHVFTHYVPLTVLENSIDILRECSDLVKELYNGKITSEDIDKINSNKKDVGDMKRSNFSKAIVDAYYVKSFDIDKAEKIYNDRSVITLYRTNVGIREILEYAGIDINDVSLLDENTLLLDKRQIELLYNNMPYLIAMGVTDWSEIDCAQAIGDVIEEKKIEIPKPKNEPLVGVIDTHFDEEVYFSEWVKYKNCMDDVIEIEAKDKEHGTAVASIIVDGPSFNPKLQDNCGRFRVKLFGVCKAKGFSVFWILRKIREIVAKNRDIKVWNLSLGSYMEIEENFISPAAAELDRIQYEYDVIFVVAGTNNEHSKEKMKIGSPADSLNSIVVNAVSFSGKPASYSRVGPVLDFFYKPDVCYYGGDSDEAIRVCTPLGEKMVMGTSFAAPWITRKVAYLIYVMGLSREIAKALIIDSAAGWDRQDISSYEMGYGIVPIKIDDILSSKDNEIKFLLSGTIEDFETYTYNIPVPQDDKGFPYFAKATLAYFPMCDRNQGVDYTSTEMDIHFGRLKIKNGKPAIYSINNNLQSESGLLNLRENYVRKFYRKWDNVKHISEELSKNAKTRTVFELGMWGLSIKTKERAVEKAGRGLQFGVVVTLYEMKGVNRINEFKKLCMMRNWLVNTVDIDNQIDVYNMAEEEIELE